MTSMQPIFPLRHGIGGAVVAISIATVPIAAAPGAPQAVSTGSPITAQRLATSCPTFSWSDVHEGKGHELAIYEVAQDHVLTPIVRTSAPGSASSWTPTADECPRSGGRFAWAVRAVSKKGVGPWFEPLLFETPGPLTDDQVRQALETLRIHRAERTGASGNRVLLALAPDGRDSETGDKQYSKEHRLASGSSGSSGSALVETTVASVVSPISIGTPPSFSLNLEGDVNLGGFVFKEGVPFLHNQGVHNTGLGINALHDVFTGQFNTAVGANTLTHNTRGSFNTASGFRSLYYNTYGDRNTAHGSNALSFNTTGTGNTASGLAALAFNSEGSYNTATGAFALHESTTGLWNTASGFSALSSNQTGNFNTAVGSRVGQAWTTGSYNIGLGFGAYGVDGESNTIRIGGEDWQTETFIEGISATAVSGSQVLITADDQLGVRMSSARVKQDIHDIQDVDGVLAKLRPVSFRYKDEVAASGENPIEYGLIAEEVAKVFPELVINDEQGRPFTVRYHLLAPLLLAEVQRQAEELAELRRLMADRDRESAKLERRLEKLAAKNRFR